jgi:hypothetical protein
MEIQPTPDQQTFIRQAPRKDRNQRSITPSAAASSPFRRIPAEAAERIRTLMKNIILPEGMTLRATIGEGRAENYDILFKGGF